MEQNELKLQPDKVHNRNIRMGHFINPWLKMSEFIENKTISSNSILPTSVALSLSRICNVSRVSLSIMEWISLSAIEV